VWKWAGTILSDGIKTFFCVLMVSVRELNCHTVHSFVGSLHRFWFDLIHYKPYIPRYLFEGGEGVFECL
jgi:hypothetical protein